MIDLAADETLLVLKIAFLVLLYAFILYVVRTATRDIGGVPQESIILGAREADALRAEYGVSADRAAARFVVVHGPGLATGTAFDVSASTVVGRDRSSGIHLDGDEFASAQHARIEPRADGIWVEDLGSTNGTFLNGERIAAERLAAGDVLRVGQTELRLET